MKQAHISGYDSILMHKLKAQMDNQLGLATQISAQLYTCADNPCLSITWEVQVSTVVIVIKTIKSVKSTIMYHRITVVPYHICSSYMKSSVEVNKKDYPLALYIVDIDRYGRTMLISPVLLFPIFPFFSHLNFSNKNSLL